VYLNTVSPATLALLDALPQDDAPLLVHVHELGIGLGSVPPDDLARLLDRAGAVVAVSRAVADHLAEHHGVDPARIHLGPGFVDTAAVPGGARSPGPGVVVAAVGLPDWRKAPELLLHALWRARQQRPDLDLRLTWVGGDPASDDGRHLADEARRLGLADRLTHVAHTADPARLLAGADVLALPSREDAFPLAALEGAAAGLPVVAFASGGVAELVDAATGRVVPYPDVDALAAALVELAADAELRRALGAAGRERVRERHDVAVGAPRIWAAAEALLGGAGR
jgi:glycosyltransferase involved in cell wall biosynthesis